MSLENGVVVNQSDKLLSSIFKALRILQKAVSFLQNDNSKHPTKKILIAMGGNLPHTENNVEYYDFHNEKWSEVTYLPFGISRGSLFVFEGKVFNVGGWSNGSIQNKISSYDILSNSWSILGEMPIDKFSHNIAVLDDYLYIIGGHVAGKSTNSVEKYDLKRKNVAHVASMNNSRELFGVAVLDEKIYAIGGDARLMTVEYYDKNTDNWISVSNMTVPRAALCVCAVNGKIYAIGGKITSFSVDTWLSELYTDIVEMYDPTTDRWTIRTPMRIPRGYADVAVFDNEIYIVGGLNGDNDLKSVEIYNVETDTWRLLPEDMKFERYHHSVIVTEI